MVQHELSLKSILYFDKDLTEEPGTAASVSQEHVRIRNIKAVTVKVTKARFESEEDTIEWKSGDVPRFNSDGGIVLASSETPYADQPIRQPPFQASEYCRLLHIFKDSRMTSVVEQIRRQFTRQELDAERGDPWTDQIAPLFNDLSFKSQKVAVFIGGVCRSDTENLDPAARPHVREGGFLSSKFSDFRAEYTTTLSRYTNTGQGDPDGFRNFASGRTYIMYGFCLVNGDPILESLTTKEVEEDAQRECGVGENLRGGNRGAAPRPTNKRNTTTEIQINGLELVAEALSGSPELAAVRIETEKAERDKMKLEVSQARSNERTARASSMEALFSAIEKTKSMQSNATSDMEQEAYTLVLKGLYNDLREISTPQQE